MNTRIFLDPASPHGPTLTGVCITSPADHPQIKRRPMSHPLAKTLYLSATGEPTVVIGDWIITLPGGRSHYSPKEETEALIPQPLPQYFDPRSYHEPTPLPRGRTLRPPSPPAAPNDTTNSDIQQPLDEESPP